MADRTQIFKLSQASCIVILVSNTQSKCESNHNSPVFHCNKEIALISEGLFQAHHNQAHLQCTKSGLSALGSFSWYWLRTSDKKVNKSDGEWGTPLKQTNTKTMSFKRRFTGIFLNSLTPNTYYRLISPYHIITESHIKVMRMKEMIN